MPKSGVMTLEEDVSLWGKVIAAMLGTVTLLGTLLGVGRWWLRYEEKLTALERHVSELQENISSMQEQLLQNTREAMNATAQATLVADRLAEQGKQFEKQVDRIVQSLDGVQSQVNTMEQG